MRQIYISGALTNLEDSVKADYKEFYVKLGDICKEYDFDSYVPHLFADPEKHKDLSSEEVNDKDTKAVLQSHILLAVLDYPSLGVGMEIVIANHSGQKIIFMHRKEANVSRMALGLRGIIKIVYEDFDDAYKQLRSLLAAMRKSCN